jgi:HSP20 family protein
MTIMRPRTFNEMSISEAIDRLFDESFGSPRGWFGVDRFERPPIDAFTTPDAFVVKVAVPGLKPEDIHTTVTGDVLAVEGTYREETERKEQGYLYRELNRGELRRSIRLPAGLKTDAAEATYADGILTLRIPKLEEVKPREIQVKAA